MPGGYRRYIWTINDLPQDLADTPVLKLDSSVVSFAIYQLERAPETGHLHIQGYFELKKSLSVGKAGALLAPYKPHLERANGTTDQCIAYCSKAESRIGCTRRWGEPRGQGKRSDLSACLECFKDPKRRLDQILADDAIALTYIKYHKGLEKYRALVTNQASSRTVSVYVLYGPTGTGKTRLAMGGGPGISEVQELAARDQIYCKPFGDKWFDGYDGQPRLVLDEYTGWLPWAKLLQICDVYPVQLEIKGGFSHARYTEVYITTNKFPTAWYKNKESHWPAFERRVTYWVYCGVPGVDKWDWFDSYDGFAAHCKPRDPPLELAVE